VPARQAVHQPAATMLPAVHPAGAVLTAKPTVAEAKQLKQEQALAKKAAAQEAARAKKAAAAEAARAKKAAAAEAARAKKAATDEAARARKGPADSWSWEHVRKPGYIVNRTPTGSVVGCGKTKFGPGGAALGPIIVFGKQSVRFNIDRMTADGVVVGVADASGPAGAVLKPLARACGPQAWGVDLGRSCLLVTSNCNEVKRATLGAKQQDLHCTGHSAIVDVEVDMEAQSLSFSVNGQPPVRGAVRLTDKVRPWVLTSSQGDEVVLGRTPQPTSLPTPQPTPQPTATSTPLPTKPNAGGSSAATRPPAAFKYDCFLTHDWGTDEKGRDNHLRVSRINTALQQAGLTTWFDEERMVGDIVQQMCDGIDQSLCVIVFITQNYIAKVSGCGPKGATDNCKREFGYSWRRKGVEFMHACVMERRCEDTSSWKGGVGMNIGGKLYTPLWDDEPSKFADAIADIKSSIEAMRAQAQPSRSLGQPHPIAKGQSSREHVEKDKKGLQRSIDLFKKELGVRGDLPMAQAVQQANQMCGLTPAANEPLPEQVDKILGVLGIEDE